MNLDVGIAFFLLGAFAAAVRADIQFPKALYQSLVLFLMIAIGLKGGISLVEHASWELLAQAIAVISIGFVLPVIAFPILRSIGELNRYDAASIAAHYGSVSVGTYAVAIGFLEASGITYESYIPLFVVLLEMPAIIVGIALAKRGAQPTQPQDAADGRPQSGELWHEIFLNQGVLLMFGGLLVGVAAGPKIIAVEPFFFGLFGGVLALFLLQMGMTAASQFSSVKRNGSFIIAFGFAMPMIGAVLAGIVGIAIGLSQGGITLLAVLGASSSYIAVPAAMKVALPEANQSLSISASLGITFPFNVLIGIPAISATTQALGL